MSARLSELSIAEIIGFNKTDLNLGKKVVLLQFIPPYSEIEYQGHIWIGGKTGGWVVAGSNLRAVLENDEIEPASLILVSPEHLRYVSDTCRVRYKAS